jgi:hypothetical protein
LVAIPTAGLEGNPTGVPAVVPTTGSSATSTPNPGGNLAAVFVVLYILWIFVTFAIVTTTLLIPGLPFLVKSFCYTLDRIKTSINIFDGLFNIG